MKLQWQTCLSNTVDPCNECCPGALKLDKFGSSKMKKNNGCNYLLEWVIIALHYTENFQTARNEEVNRHIVVRSFQKKINEVSEKNRKNSHGMQWDSGDLKSTAFEKEPNALKDHQRKLESTTIPTWSSNWDNIAVKETW